MLDQVFIDSPIILRTVSWVIKRHLTRQMREKTLSSHEENNKCAFHAIWLENPKRRKSTWKTLEEMEGHNEYRF
jgi:hypothetical protein